MYEWVPGMASAIEGLTLTRQAIEGNISNLLLDLENLEKEG
jgi:hypothetical protein